MQIFGLLVLLFLFSGSCIEVPFSLDISSPMKVTSKKYEDSLNSIIDNWERFFKGEEGEEKKPTNSSGDDILAHPYCINAFIHWFEQGVSNGQVLLEEKSNSFANVKDENGNYALVDPVERTKCREFTFNGYDYAQAAVNLVLSSANIKTSQLMVIDPYDMRKKYDDSKCLKEALDKQEILNIIEFFVTIDRNTLNYPVPPIKIYYSNKNFTKDELEDSDFFTKHKNELKLLSQSSNLPVKSTGELPLKVSFEQDIDGYLDNLSKFRGVMIAQIGPYFKKPEIFRDPSSGKDYFLIPNGETDIRFGFDVTLKAPVGPGSCFLDEAVKESKEKDKERRAKFEERKRNNNNS